jgi:ABC-type amino acid transport substrate-binding protein
MRRRHRLFCFMALSWGTCGQSANVRHLTISAPDWPPFYIQDSNLDDARGMAWDILKICSKKYDSAAVFEMFPIRRMFKYMEDGSLDLNIMSYKADRVNTLAFGKEVVFENSYGVWTRASLATKIISLHDIKKLSIAQLIGLRPSDEFKAMLEARLHDSTSKETLILNDPDQIVRMLASDRIDATVASLAEIRWRAQRLKVSQQLRFSGLIVQRQKYYFVLSRQSPFYKERPQILTGLDQCVRDLRRSGAWDQLRLRYQL